MCIDDSMLEYCHCEADRYNMIGPYMNKCHSEVLFSIDLSRSNNNVKEESLEETVIESNTYIYDSNDTHILTVGNTVMSIGNVMESGFVVVFENGRNHALMRLGRIEMNIFSVNKFRYVHSNNSTLINTLSYS